MMENKMKMNYKIYNSLYFNIELYTFLYKNDYYKEVSIILWHIVLVFQSTVFKYCMKIVITRVIYDRVRKRKNYFEIPAFLQIERGKSRAGKF